MFTTSMPYVEYAINKKKNMFILKFLWKTSINLLSAIGINK